MSRATPPGVPLSDGERFVGLLDMTIGKLLHPGTPILEIVATLQFLRDTLAPRVPEIAEWSK